MYESSFDHFDALILETIVPLAVLVAAELYSKSVNRLRAPTDTNSHKQHILSAWLTMLFLILPVVSRRICQSFTCDAYEDGTEVMRYLRADTAIDCSSLRHDLMSVFAMCMVLVYPIGAPLLLFILLFQHRENLNPPDREEEDVIEARKVETAQSYEDKVLAEALADDPVTSFALHFRPRFWWYEVYNMSRRLLLTCVVLICDGLAQTTLFVTTVAIVTLVIEQETKPYCASFLSAYCNVACWQILLFALYLLLLDAAMTEGFQAALISSLLMLANVALIATIFTETKVNREHREESIRRKTKFVKNRGLKAASKQLNAISHVNIFDNPLFRKNGRGDTAGTSSRGGVEMKGRSPAVDPSPIEIEMNVASPSNEFAVEGISNPIFSAAASGPQSDGLASTV
eukprot:CAMPEP_0205918708 /NCGR_PEP_ID=MMETSP1325-20131115/9977_1 /ASSEMBLY_ACC=CAM_ASM_000708 /TAXON_ID=236786 /ORGANISM="Florenciella sp., Strain RCC1007" /LENGTH=400 /DNA_ID=CAMNT_0053286261 /DNA_START=21 /DNA_END=1223 /DNA_ORIENTATION=+